MSWLRVSDGVDEVCKDGRTSRRMLDFTFADTFRSSCLPWSLMFVLHEKESNVAAQPRATRDTTPASTS
jgi:hypothetical protein